MRRAAAWLFAGALATLLPLASQAQLFRAYLASDGVDTNPCTLQAPCRLLPAALAAVASGGEVWMLDSANYNTGTVTLAKSVTLLAVPGALGSVVVAGGDALAIPASGVRVALRNLAIGPLPGNILGLGINVTGGGVTLVMEKCLVTGVQAYALQMDGASVLRIADTIFRDNTAGLILKNGASATVTRAILSGHSSTAIAVQAGAVGPPMVVEVADSILDSNDVGVQVDALSSDAIVKVFVRDSQVVRNVTGLSQNAVAGSVNLLGASRNIVSDNVSSGIRAQSAGSVVWASGNTVTDNGGFGLDNAAGGTFETASDNFVRGNGAGNAIGVVAVPRL